MDPIFLCELPSIVDNGGVIRAKAQYLCRCGKKFSARVGDINTGNTQSCGCLFKQKLIKRLTIHNESKTTEYKTWASMKRRCNDTGQQNYKYYGGRGIKVCARWLEKKGKGYLNFLSDLGRRPTIKHSIDRIDNNGNYEPDNCKWSTHTEQMNNTRRICGTE